MLKISCEVVCVPFPIITKGLFACLMQLAALSTAEGSGKVSGGSGQYKGNLIKMLSQSNKEQRPLISWSDSK